MTDLDYIVDFSVHLGEEMLIAGANIERVNLTIESICRHYGIKELGLNAMNTMITLSASDENGNSTSKTVKITSSALNMEKLKDLAALAKKVVHEKPDPKLLSGMLAQTLGQVVGHHWYTTLFAFLVAMAALARIFGGSWQDILIALVNTVILFFLSKGFEKLHLNHIITNFISMFLVTVIAALMSNVGFVQNVYVVILTNAFYLIPGIPMVNSVRCLICGNEMNGIIELLKVVLETLTIVAGSAAAIYFFESVASIKLEEAFPVADYTDIVYDIELVVLSFLASFGFGLVFNMSWKEIIFAGVGATLVRIVLILLLLAIPTNRFVVFLLSSFSADVFSEALAMYKKRPATYYLYSFIVPLIPGDLVAYVMFGIVWFNHDLFQNNLINCMLSLLGISVGFVLASSIMHFVRKIRLKKLFPTFTKK